MAADPGCDRHLRLVRALNVALWSFTHTHVPRDGYPNICATCTRMRDHETHRTPAVILRDTP